MDGTQKYEEQAKIFKALGHPARLMMVDLLRDGARCVSELQKAVGSDMSVVSKHLAILKECHVVVSEKRGNQVYYSLRMPCLGQFLACSCSVMSDDILPDNVWPDGRKAK